MFLMNYIFDFAKDTAIFEGDQNSQSGLDRFSKNWLKLVPTPGHPDPPIPTPTRRFDPAFDSEAKTWKESGDMDTGSILQRSFPVRPPTNARSDTEGNVGIRIAPTLDSAGNPTIMLGSTGAQLALAVCFGKPDPHRQVRSSPFQLDDGAAKSTFIFPFEASNQMRAGAPFSWFFYLGAITFRPDFNDGPHRIHRYQYSVGIIAVSGGVERHFSHDPDMDIGA